MKDEPKPEPRSTVERHPWPDKLQARVWASGARPRVHGYDLHDDIARHYGFAELVLTSLRGRAPSREEGSLFEAVMLFLSPTFVSEAPAHTAVVARTVDSRWPAIIACGSTVLAEQAHALVEQHAELLRWLDDPSGPFPEPARCHDDEERLAVARFASRAEQSTLSIPALAHDPTLFAAILAAAHCCGIAGPEAMSAMVVVARLPGVLSEALRPGGKLREYPMDLPHVTYRAHAETEESQEGQGSSP